VSELESALAELARLRRLGIDCCDCDGLSDDGDCECVCHRIAESLAGSKKWKGR